MTNPMPPDAGLSGHGWDQTIPGLLEAAPDAMIVIDRDGRIMVLNSRAEEMFGYHRSELIGGAIERLVPERYRAAHPEHRASYAARPKPRPMGSGLKLEGRRKDGTEFPVEISLSPIEITNGQFVIAAVRDVTEQRLLREQLEEQHRQLIEQYRRLQQAGRLKSEFLANMSHELLTPLNGIIGFAEILHDKKAGAVSAIQQEYLGDILTSAQHLLRLVKDVLDLAKVDAGRMEFHPEPQDLATILRDVQALVRASVLKRGLQVETELDSTIGPVMLDGAKLKQVLHHYLTNAIKFTPQGNRIVIRIRAEGAAEFRLEVEDTGIGIPEGELDRLFVDFQQLDPSTSKKYQGTGLGLGLVKRIVTAQGGRVGVRSTPGVGSTFFAVLPRASSFTVTRDPPHSGSDGAEPVNTREHGRGESCPLTPEGSDGR